MGNLFGKAPKVEPPSRMPDEEDPALKDARRKRQQEMMQRSGRDSTILSDSLTGSSGKLGA